MELSELVTVGGAAVLVSILVEAVKRAAAMSAGAVDRFGLLMALAFGQVVSVPTALWIGSDLGSAVVSGLLAGAASVGVYKGVQKIPTPGALVSDEDLAGRG